MSAGQQALVTPANSAGNSSYDPYYNNVTLLLSMNGSGGSTTFLDTSQNRLIVTANGGAQISTAQSKFGGSSAYLDGSGDYLTSPNNPAFLFGSEDFTLECWVYLTAYASAGTWDTVAGVWAGSGQRSWQWLIGVSGVTYWNMNEGGFNFAGTTVLALNTWYHIAITRSGSSWAHWVNGVQSGTGTSSAALSTSTGLFTIGATQDVGIFTWQLSGYVDDFRITKGIARYTANFTPPVYANPRIGPSYDTFYNNVSLLLGMNGSNGSTYFPDNSGSPKTVTANADAKVSTAQWKWGGSSAYFDGTGDYLSTPNSSAFDFGSGDLTIEAWVYIAANSSPDIDGVRAAVICNAWGVNPSGWKFAIDGNTTTTGTGLAWDTWNSTFTAGTLWRATGSISQGTWHHVAATVSGGTRRLFLNGVLLSGSTITVGAGYTEANTNGNSIYVGKTPTTNYQAPLNGYIDDLRITKGIARYTANFTPPAGPFANTGPTADPYYDYVTLLLPMNGTNTSNSFIDSSKTAKIISVTGNTQISTTQWKFGGSSVFFDGNIDWLSTPATTEINFQGSDFTIEFWVYRTSSAIGTVYSMARDQSGTGYGPVRIDFTTALTVRPLIANSGNTGWASTATGTATIALNTWGHYALVKTGTTIKQYINGTLDLTLTSMPATFTDVTRDVTIGYNNSTDAQYYTGYVDDFRITKGVARYTANFTVPAQPSPVTGVQYDNYYDNVSLLLSMNGANNGTSFLDSSPRSKTVTVNGNTITSTAQYKWGVSSAYFDGTGDYLTNSNNDLNFGTGDFTIELWQYSEDVSSTTQRGLFQTSTTAGGLSTSYTTGIILAQGANGVIPLNGGCTVNILGTYISGTSSSVLITNSWQHIAITRSNGNCRLFVNGVQHGTTTIISGSINATNIAIGGYYNPSFLFRGYIDDFRVTKGVARYTANFTPLTQAFPDGGPATDPFYYNTSLLLHMNGTNGNTVFTDTSPVSKNVTPSGNAQISTAQFKWGGSSALFDGSGDYLSIPYSSAFDFGNSNFTIECWLYRTGANANSSRIWNSGGDFYGQVEISLDPSGTLGSYGTTQGAAWDAWSNGSIGAIPLNTWTHIALVRNGGTVRAYINGIGTTLTSSLGSSALANGSGASSIRTIGGQPGTDRPYSGYIDDFRVTKGVARYSNNFTPPQQQLPDQ